MDLFDLWLIHSFAKSHDKILGLSKQEKRRIQLRLWEPHIAKLAFIQHRLDRWWFEGAPTIKPVPSILDLGSKTKVPER
jgi:hypothetical protein